MCCARVCVRVCLHVLKIMNATQHCLYPAPQHKAKKTVHLLCFVSVFFPMESAAAIIPKSARSPIDLSITKSTRCSIWCDIHRSICSIDFNNQVKLVESIQCDRLENKIETQTSKLTDCADLWYCEVYKFDFRLDCDCDCCWFEKFCMSIVWILLAALSKSAQSDLPFYSKSERKKMKKKCGDIMVIID